MNTADKIQSALLVAAEAIEQRANGAGRIIRHPGQTALCGSPEHDDRYCSVCRHMEDGMDLAARLVRELAREQANQAAKGA